MTEFTGAITKLPARAALMWYLGGISLGAMALLSPWCHGAGAAEHPISILDAVFTSTSATCVTGLAVRSTGHDFNFWGQLVILAMMQIGGVGIMTVSTFLMLSIDGRLDLRRRIAIMESLGGDGRTDLKWLIRNVLLFTLVAESLGALVLSLRFAFDQPFPVAIWNGIFHSVSAFCNGGFGLQDDSLSRYAGDPVVNMTIMALIVSGGIGFPVLLDLRRQWYGPWEDRWDRLHLNSKLLLIGTTFLIFAGTAAFLTFEWNHQLQQYPRWQRPIVAMFQSVTCRTAGFNTLEIGALTNASLFLSIILMAIGGGACSTAGGIKVSTVMILMAHAWNAIRGRGRINLFRKTIPEEAVRKAIAAVMIFFLITMVSMFSVLVIEQNQSNQMPKGEFLDTLFEVVSALGTVGLSTGITPHLSSPSLVLLTVLMIIGRVGPITVFVALSQRSKSKQIEFLKEEPFIG